MHVVESILWFLITQNPTGIMAYTACKVLEAVFTSPTSDNDLTPPDLGSLLVSDLPNCLKNEESFGGPDSLPLKPVESCLLFSCECSNTLLSDFDLCDEQHLQ